MSGVSSIGEGAFSGCLALEGITLPGNLQVLGASAFESCVHLKKIVLPDGIRTLPEGVFQNCSQLQKVYLPRNLSKVCNGAFRFQQPLTVYWAGSASDWTRAGISISQYGNDALVKASFVYNATPNALK